MPRRRYRTPGSTRIQLSARTIIVKKELNKRGRPIGHHKWTIEQKKFLIGWVKLFGTHAWQEASQTFCKMFDVSLKKSTLATMCNEHLYKRSALGREFFDELRPSHPLLKRIKATASTLRNSQVESKNFESFEQLFPRRRDSHQKKIQRTPPETPEPLFDSDTELYSDEDIWQSKPHTPVKAKKTASQDVAPWPTPTSEADENISSSRRRADPSASDSIPNILFRCWDAYSQGSVDNKYGIRSQRALTGGRVPVSMDDESFWNSAALHFNKARDYAHEGSRRTFTSPFISFSSSILGVVSLAYRMRREHHDSDPSIVVVKTLPAAEKFTAAAPLVAQVVQRGLKDWQGPYKGRYEWVAVGAVPATCILGSIKLSELQSHSELLSLSLFDQFWRPQSLTKRIPIRPVDSETIQSVLGILFKLESRAVATPTRKDLIEISMTLLHDFNFRQQSIQDIVAAAVLGYTFQRPAPQQHRSASCNEPQGDVAKCAESLGSFSGHHKPKVVGKKPVVIVNNYAPRYPSGFDNVPFILDPSTPKGHLQSAQRPVWHSP